MSDTTTETAYVSCPCGQFTCWDRDHEFVARRFRLHMLRAHRIEALAPVIPIR